MQLNAQKNSTDKTVWRRVITQHTTLFQRSYNVIWILWALDGRCFDVVCWLGRDQDHDTCISSNSKLKIKAFEIQFIDILATRKDKAGFTHTNYVDRFLKFSKQTQAKSHLNAMTSPILKNLWTVYRFWPDSCLEFAWKFWEFVPADKLGVCKSGLTLSLDV